MRVTESGVDTSACECEREQTASVRARARANGVGANGSERTCVRANGVGRTASVRARASASETALATVHAGKNARTPSITRLLSSSQDRRHVASRAHTCARGDGGRGGKPREVVGGKSSSLMTVPPTLQYPSLPVSPPAPHPAGKTMASYTIYIAFLLTYHSVQCSRNHPASAMTSSSQYYAINSVMSCIIVTCSSVTYSSRSPYHKGSYIAIRAISMTTRLYRTKHKI